MQPLLPGMVVLFFNKKSLEHLDQIKEGQTISVMNAFAKVTNRFLKIDVDKWARVVVSTD